MSDLFTGAYTIAKMPIAFVLAIKSPVTLISPGLGDVTDITSRLYVPTEMTLLDYTSRMTYCVSKIVNSVV